MNWFTRRFNEIDGAGRAVMDFGLNAGRAALNTAQSGIDAAGTRIGELIYGTPQPPSPPRVPSAPPAPTTVTRQMQPLDTSTQLSSGAAGPTGGNWLGDTAAVINRAVTTAAAGAAANTTRDMQSQPGSPKPAASQPSTVTNREMQQQTVTTRPNDGPRNAAAQEPNVERVTTRDMQSQPGSPKPAAPQPSTVTNREMQPQRPGTLPNTTRSDGRWDAAVQEVNAERAANPKTMAGVQYDGSKPAGTDPVSPKAAGGAKPQAQNVER